MLPNPTTFASEDGTRTLYVDPTDLYGRGPANCEYRVRGELKWKRQLSVTLTDVAIAKDGSIIGYGVSEAPGTNMGNLNVLVLDPGGKLRNRLTVERKHSLALHTPPVPTPKGFFIDEARNRAVLRATDFDGNQRVEHFWAFDMLSGKRTSVLVPEKRLDNTDGRRLHMMAACAVPGTELTLVHYRSSPSFLGARGGLITLIDDSGEPVWILDRPGDYSIPSDEEAQRLLDEQIREIGVTRSTGRGAFDVWFVKSNERVAYRVELADTLSGWNVVETGRRPFAPAAKPQPAEREFEPIYLREIATVKLQNESSEPSAIRDILKFGFELDGTLRFIRWEEGGGYSAVWVTPQGGILREVPISGLNAQSSGFSSWLFPEHGPWRRFFEDYENEGEMQVWAIHAREGRAELIAEAWCPGCPFSAPINATPSGGYVALGTHTPGINSGPSLRSFDASFNLQWENAKGFNGGDHKDPSTLFAPEDLCVLADGRIAVVDNIRNLIQIFQADGSFSHSFDLAEVMGQEPNYPSELSRDLDAGLLLEDFDDRPAYWRFGVDGTLRGSFLPKHPRDVKFNQVSIAPNGQIWASDGQLLFALADDGSVESRLGPAIENDSLQDVGAVGVDQMGRIHIQDERSGAIHVFNRAGEKLRVLPAAPRVDEYADPTTTQLLFGPDGVVYIGEEWGDLPYVKLDEAGNKAGQVDLGANPVTFVPGTQMRWGWKDGLVLVDGSGTIIKAIQRRPGDRHWMLSGSPPAVASDGRVAVLTGGLALFSAAGEPLKRFEFPIFWGDELSFSGQWAVVENYLIDVEAGRVKRLEGDGFEHLLIISPAGDELWSIDPYELTLRRFELP